MTIRDIAVALGFEVDNQSMQKAEQSVDKLKSFATKALATIGVGVSLVELNAIAEEFGNINNRIRSATKGLKDQEAVQEDILTAANNMRMSYEYTSNFVSKLIQENKELFGNVSEAAKFAELTGKLFKASGKSSEEIASLQEAINVSFAQGIVDTETLNRLLEDAPEAANMLAASIGTTSDKLVGLASNGQISLAQLKNAFMSNEAAINESFESVALNISDAKLQIRNMFGETVDDLNQTLGLTQTIAQAMVKGFSIINKGLQHVNSFLQMLNSKLGGSNNTLKLVTMSVAAMFLAFNGKAGATAAINMLKMMGKALKRINLRMILVAAGFLALFLIIDDIINFVKGNNSVLGMVFEKFGIDGEKVRETLTGLWDIIKELFGSIIEKVMPVLADIASELMPYILEFFESFKRIGPSLVDLGKSLANLFMKLGEVVLKVLVLAFNALMPLVRLLVEKLLPKIADVIIDLIPVIIAIATILCDVLGWAFGVCAEIVETVLIPILEGVIAFLEGDWMTGIQKVGEAFTNAFRSALGIVDDLFGTNLQGWYDRVYDFFYDLGGKIFEMTHAEELAALDLHDKYIDMNADMSSMIVQLMKDGATAEEALSQAKQHFLDTTEKIYYYDSDLSNTINLDTVKGWQQNLVDSGQIPAMASGGIVTKPTHALIGEGGEPEAVLPLSKLKLLLERVSLFGINGKGGAQNAANNISNTKTVTQNVTINNSFSGGVASAQTEGAKTMNSAAHDATAILARGLQYSR